MTGLGMTVRADTFAPDPDRIARNIDWGGPADRPRMLTNVIAVLPGANPALPAVALIAHHDSVADSPGAADDGAGVAAILETVRAVTAGPRPARDLVVALTDGEEIGLDGARRFFAGLPPPADPIRDHIGALINLEARGGGGRATLFQTADDNGDAIALAFWINGTDSGECCAFSGGPFVESRYFGEGIGIGVRKGNDLLRQSLNWALFRIWEKGRFTDLWLRYFSISPF